MTKHVGVVQMLGKLFSVEQEWLGACRTRSNVAVPITVSPAKKNQLDDGWPESVEEQSLLLLVWRHYITRQYTKDVS